MARFDKVDPKDGSFRAPLGFSIAAADVGTVIGVGINAAGLAVKGAGTTGVVGVICPTETSIISDPIDVMTDGEIVDIAGQVAGAMLYAVPATGVLNTTNTGVRVGHTVQPWRLIVRVAR